MERGGCAPFTNLTFHVTFVKINKAKTMCECLVASEGIDLKLEDAFCLFLLGQVQYSFWSILFLALTQIKYCGNFFLVSSDIIFIPFSILSQYVY